MAASGATGREFTYPDVGAGRGDPPAGYRTLGLTRVLGRGDGTFETAATRLFGWDMHRAAGIRIAPGTPPPAPGVDVQLDWGAGPFRFTAWCRVVTVVDETHRRGFSYGTLTGHPESGEETFVVERSTDGVVTARVTAFSRPARWYTRLAGPLGHQLQRRIARKYLDGLLPFQP